MATYSPHLAKVHELWKRLKHGVKEGKYVVDGNSLHIGDVVATARHDVWPQLSQDARILQSLQDSVATLFDHLERGWYVYGVNTGFGGSADSRTKEVVKLQSSLMQHTQSGILSSSSASTSGSLPRHAMPSSWVRAGMVVRCNSTMRGHSAVSLPPIKAMTTLLKEKLTPVVPLRGSVSASGDLMPLAYVAGALEGNPDILLEKGGKALPSDRALEDAGIPRVVLGPKEGLGLINGTSASAGLAALVVADAHLLTLLTQFLSAGAVEGSHLSRDILAPKDRRREDLVQDRYSLRSAPQWIGPQLEDLLLADQQITIELNSSCDNPLVDSTAGDIYYGCNFQAAVVTSAMEKVRLSLQMLGRMLFAQSTEMIDPTLSGGLPANLAADDPSLSFTMKGVDVNMAAYMAELSYLANPMSSHVQAAEMHNQSVNSMALASARMSHDAVDILTKMSACSAFVVCQALDLRALHQQFIDAAGEVLGIVAKQVFFAVMDTEHLTNLIASLTNHTGPAWSSTSKLDLRARCEALVRSAVPIVIAHIGPGVNVAAVQDWQLQATDQVFALWTRTREAFIADPPTESVLGKGSRVLYHFVRKELGVPFHQGFVEHPTWDSPVLNDREKRSIGGWISIIHDSIQNGAIYDGLMALVAEGLLADGI
ncbi:hypothetical protein AnigIFM50267_010814 [Aspergillus niger]|nr:hypothetical protein AnigIFM50267_010814 [Aspergillus niger]